MDQAENLRRLVRNKNSARSGPLVAAIASGKGGTGKTSFCVNLGIALSMLGKTTMIIDADFGLSNVDVMLDAHPKHHIGEVLRGEVPLSEAVCKGHGGLLYVGGASGPDELLQVKRSMIESLQRQIAKMDTKLDFILIDCGAGVSDTILRIIAATDECLVVVTPEPTAITDAFVLLKGMVSKPGCPPVHFVMNRSETPMEAVTMSRHFKSIVTKYLRIEPRFLGYVSFDKSVILSIKRQQPLVLAYPNSQAAKDIQRIAAQYADVEVGRPGGLFRFFDKLFMRYGS